MIASKDLNTNEKYHVGSESFNFDDRTQVINHIDTFCVFDRRGDIHPDGKKAHGIFHRGTRYLSQLELTIDTTRPHLLSSAVKSDNEVLSVDMTNSDLHDCMIKENSIHIKRQQFVRNGSYYEEIELANYSKKACSFNLSLSFDADFADIFEIRGMQRTVAEQKPKLSSADNKICFEYEGNDSIIRTTEIIFNQNDDAQIKERSANFLLKLKPHETSSVNYTSYFKNSEEQEEDESVPSIKEMKKDIEKDKKNTFSLFAHIESDNENFNNWLLRSRTDLQSLLAKTKYGFYPYAGVPWYNTAFGRDAIITAMQLLWAAPLITKDVLIFLAATQSKRLDPSNDAEPGKIIHEMRFGEMANTGEIPFRRYYGTIDATPLFLMLAGMYFVQTRDHSTIKKIWDNIKAAISWINEYGDIDGDGFIEYKSKNKNGLTNQGWKDSYDAVMHEDGELCEPPIALCEVQGYAYAAKKYSAMMASALKEESFAETLDREAEKLKKAFFEKFWDEKLGSYVLALDGNKKPCRVMASNTGHCLFSGIATKEHAHIVAKKLVSNEMFSGWGIRTLSKKEICYNPISYHNGSVWPHDNALIAYGMSKYNCKQEALQIFSGFYNAAFYLDLQRLPELFCGFEKRKEEGPTAYPVACSPQAWAVASIYMLLQSILGVIIDGLQKQIVFNKPKLPVFLNKILIRHLQLHGGYCSFEVYRHEHDVGFHILHKPSDWDVIIKN